MIQKDSNINNHQKILNIFIISAFLTILLMRVLFEFLTKSYFLTDKQLPHSLIGTFLICLTTVIFITYDKVKENKITYLLIALMGIGAGLLLDEAGRFLTHGYNYQFSPTLAIAYIILLLLWSVGTIINIIRYPNCRPKNTFIFNINPIVTPLVRNILIISLWLSVIAGFFYLSYFATTLGGNAKNVIYPMIGPIKPVTSDTLELILILMIPTLIGLFAVLFTYFLGFKKQAIKLIEFSALFILYIATPILSITKPSIAYIFAALTILALIILSPREIKAKNRKIK